MNTVPEGLPGSTKHPPMLCHFPVVFAERLNCNWWKFILFGSGKESFNFILDPDVIRITTKV